jgi:ketosteroid isomerase-like protein
MAKCSEKRDPSRRRKSIQENGGKRKPMDASRQAVLVREIHEIIDRETEAWNEKDPDALVLLFHPDMVWPWPPDNRSHDPLTWELSQGRFDAIRWRAGWQELFETYDLVHNRRETLRVVISSEGDGAFAVVDVDTLWRHKTTGEDFHWKGRAGKGYAKMPDGWKLIMHTGLLDYGG